ncbi:MAG: M42 family peptidase, partial [Gemmatimonadetes bacterium]|nr:M42 family metallopeptidase [Gemmatimonadota bacterium]NIR39804.1 M42 family metallopeptidase [Actinomycetota bacterium]NIU75893.1 M42 family peptidase [Gammaproteobacteria bacterium]NIQ57765.1 M42 family metallopeptidase [Gemmatimonadota bacterium]NIX45519.1 M42 family peptidase [Gemmatimonadota bacterium]
MVRTYVGEIADDVRTDLHGNLIATGNPGTGLRLMFDGHCDQL